MIFDSNEKDLCSFLKTFDLCDHLHSNSEFCYVPTNLNFNSLSGVFSVEIIKLKWKTNKDLEVVFSFKNNEKQIETIVNYVMEDGKDIPVFQMNYNKMKEVVKNRVSDIYSSDKRNFHTMKHIEEMFQEFEIQWVVFIEKYPKYSIPEFYKAVALAIFYHDVIYFKGNEFNEIISANVFKEHFEGLAGFYKDLIFDCILNAKKETHFNNHIEKFIHDLDWIAFSNFEKMKANTDFIVTEYISTGLTKKESIEKMISYYGDFIDKDIFFSEWNKEKNKKVHENLKKYIDYLKRMKND